MKERKESIIRDLAAHFLQKESNASSLLTVTKVEMRPDGKFSTIYFTVYPENFEKTALEFAKRKRSDFKQYVRDNSLIAHIPHFDFEIDSGEKNRQKIDTLLNQ
jgi:ribosome-binding factor A